MQIIDPNKPYFVDSVPAPNTVAVKDKFTFHNYQNFKNYFALKFVNNPPFLVAPFTYDVFSQEAYTANPSRYDALIAVNQEATGNYSYILNQVQNNGYLIYYIKISWRFTSLLDPQISQPLFYNCKDANGEIVTDQILGQEDLDPYQKDFRVINIDLRREPLLLSQFTYFTYRFVQDVANQGATFCFYYNQALQSDVLDEQKDLTNLLTEI